MANEVKLDCFTVMLKKHGSKDYVDFDDFFLETTVNSTDEKEETTEIHKKSFIDFFKAYVHSFDNKFAVQKNTGKAITIVDDPNKLKINSGQRIIYGYLEGGSTGSHSRIKTIDKVADDEAFEVTDKHVDATPFYFLIWFPADSNQGIMLVQSFSHRSITDAFKNHLRAFFKTKSDKLMMVLGSYVPKDYVEKVKRKGEIKRVRLIRKRLDGDKAKKLLRLDFMADTAINIEVVITGLNGIPGYKDKLNVFMNEFMAGNNTMLFDVEDLDEIGIDGTHETVVEFEHNGKTAKGTTNNNFKFAPSFYVTPSDLKLNALNYPTFESMHTYSLAFLEDVKETIGYNAYLRKKQSR